MSCTLIQLLEIGETSSRPNGVLHHAPAAFHGMEMMAGTGNSCKRKRPW
jgi:hypothetical protein